MHSKDCRSDCAMARVSCALCPQLPQIADRLAAEVRESDRRSIAFLCVIGVVIMAAIWGAMMGYV